jgi:HEAT repeat-containing protein 5
MLVSCKRDLQRHLEALADDTVPHKKIALGLAQALAVLVQVCPSRPLYFSTNVITEIWTLANSLLQMSGKSDLRTSQIQIQVSWTLIGALMSIGLQFVKSRLNQLLLLWQNALPRPFPRDVMAGRSHTELQYLLLVKERALAALHLFLQYNDKLLTHDISKRIATMLSDTSVFVSRLPQTTTTDDARALALQSQVTEIGIKVKMRLIRCYCCLVQHDNRNIAGPELLMTAISVFTEVDPQILRSIATKPVMAGSFDSLKSIADNYAWGVSSYMKPLSIPDSQGINTEDGNGQSGHWSVWSSESDLLERMVFTVRQ